jgi:hypothetical protein
MGKSIASLDNPLDPRIANGFDAGKYNANRPWCMYEVMMIQWDGDVAAQMVPAPAMLKRSIRQSQ